MGDAQRRAGTPVGVRRRPQRARRSARRWAPAAGPRRSSTATSPCSPPTAHPTGCCASSTCRWRCRGCRTTTSSTPSPARPRHWGSASTATAVVEGLRTFRPDDVQNPGRMNTYSVPVEGGSATVIVDLAHNEAGLEALLDVCRGPRRPLGAGPPGARARAATAPTTSSRPSARWPGCAPTTSSPRTRSTTCAGGRWRSSSPTCASASPGRVSPTSRRTRPSSRGCRPSSRPPVTATSAPSCATPSGDAIAAWLTEVGAVSDDPDAIRRKVVRARGEHEAEGEIAALWELDDDAERIARGRCPPRRPPR